MMFIKCFADYRRLFATTQGWKPWRAIKILFVPSLHITCVHRLGHAIVNLWPPFNWLLLPVYCPLVLMIKLAYNVSLPARARIDGGLIILHPVGTLVHPNVRVGRNVTLGNNVVIGVSELKDNRVPEIGDEVVVYTGAKILGALRVNHHAVIGANAVVLRDVPAFSIVGGVPARVLRMQQRQRSRSHRFRRRPRPESNVRVYSDKREGVIHV